MHIFFLNASNETTKCHFVSHLLFIYSHHRGTGMGLQLRKKRQQKTFWNSSQYLWPLLQKPTAHCIIIKVHYRLQTVWRWQTFRHPVVLAYSHSLFIHVFSILMLNSKKILTYLHIPPLQYLASDVYCTQIWSYCCWCSNFLLMFTCVQSLVMVSYTVRALWL